MADAWNSTEVEYTNISRPIGTSLHENTTFKEASWIPFTETQIVLLILSFCIFLSAILTIIICTCFHKRRNTLHNNHRTQNNQQPSVITINHGSNCMSEKGQTSATIQALAVPGQTAIISYQCSAGSLCKNLPPSYESVMLSAKSKLKNAELPPY